jgi:hypothetical protein
MLAYVFWHWKQPGIVAGEYEQRQRAFHAAFAAEPCPGFRRSFCVALAGAPWAAAGGAAYEDWYLVEDFAALGSLNVAAVSATRLAPHNAAAAAAAGGAGGLYALRLGSASLAPHYTSWFGKPAGVTYQQLFAELAPALERVGGALWMRQMVLGPAREFCVHAASPVVLPALLDVMTIPVRPVWPMVADHR